MPSCTQSRYIVIEASPCSPSSDKYSNAKQWTIQTQRLDSSIFTMNKHNSIIECCHGYMVRLYAWDSVNASSRLAKPITPATRETSRVWKILRFAPNCRSSKYIIRTTHANLTARYETDVFFYLQERTIYPTTSCGSLILHQNKLVNANKIGTG